MGRELWQKLCQIRRGQVRFDLEEQHQCVSAPFKRGETEVQIFWQGKAQNSSPIRRCTFLARRSAKLIANFSATTVTSLPSFSLSLYLSLSLSLSLSPTVPHAQYRKRFRASYNTNIHIFWEMLNRVVVGLFRSKMEVKKEQKCLQRDFFLFLLEWCVDSPKVFVPSFKTVRHSWRDFFQKSDGRRRPKEDFLLRSTWWAQVLKVSSDTIIG